MFDDVGVAGFVEGEGLVAVGTDEGGHGRKFLVIGLKFLTISSLNTKPNHFVLVFFAKIPFLLILINGADLKHCWISARIKTTFLWLIFD